MRWIDDRVVVVVGGEVDECFSAAGAQVIDTLARLDRPVEIDLSAMTFFGAAGVNWLVTLTRSVPQTVSLVRVSAVTRFVLGVCDVLVAADVEERAAAADER